MGISKIIGYVPDGYYGHLVNIDVDIRRGIPGIQIIGLPEGAVREARERVRMALTNSGFPVIGKKILVGLGPADVPKAAAGLDLAIALAIIHADAQPAVAEAVIAVGELGLHGDILPVHGVLAAVDEACKSGCSIAFVPRGNAREAALIRGVSVFGLDTLQHAWERYTDCGTPTHDLSHHSVESAEGIYQIENDSCDGEGEFLGTAELIRASQIAAAGNHHIGLFGPPGTGKTLSAHQLGSLLPDMSQAEMIETARIWSLAAMINPDEGINPAPPVRFPHHSASVEGMIGGGKFMTPGEASLAHNGLLVLDEIAEFPRSVLQALRDPLESGSIRLVRAGAHITFPARSLVCITANLCPCGAYGRPKSICSCTPGEISRYWRKFGGAIMDRIPIRVACSPQASPVRVSLGALRKSILLARKRQHDRSAAYNGIVDADTIIRTGGADAGVISRCTEAARLAGLSFRGAHHVLQLSRTIADLDSRDVIEKRDITEAAGIRAAVQGGSPWAYSHQTY